MSDTTAPSSAGDGSNAAHGLDYGHGPDNAHGRDHDHDHAHSLKPYVLVFIALLVLLAAAVIVAYIPTDNYRLRFFLTALAYTIAVIKGVLIILYFMHVKESTRLTWLFAGASFFWILIMISLMLNDYGSRGVIPQAYKQPPHVELHAK